MNTKRNMKYTVQDVIDFVNDGNQSEISEFSSDDVDEIQDYRSENNQEIPNTPITDESESEDEVPLSKLVENKSTSSCSTADQCTSVNDPQSQPKHHYRWRKKDTMVVDRTFESNFSDPPLDDMTPLQYFKLFITDDIIDSVVEQTNIYSFQKNDKSINTDHEEIMSLIGMNMKMGISKLPSYKLYWSRELRYSP